MSTNTVVWPLLSTWSVSRSLGLGKDPPHTPLLIEAELVGSRCANHAPNVEKNSTTVGDRQLALSIRDMQG
jgi:hypothetical protein